MEIRHLPAEDMVVIQLSDGAAAGAPEQLEPGLYAVRDAAGRLVRLEIRPASLHVAPGTAAPASQPQALAEVPPLPVTVYSDGGCLGNPGPGGWGARLKFGDGQIVEIGGAVPATTNNRMELTAAIEALRQVRTCPAVTMVTDSEYVQKGITQWIHSWKRRGWVTAARKPVLNQDLWQELDRLNRPDVQWRYTRGHAGDPDNERCDEIAQAFARGQVPELRQR